MTWPAIPPPPDAPADAIGRGSTRPRYEDIAQDGRLRLEGIWPPMGPILWGGSMPIVGPLARLGTQGIRAVLTRAVLWGGSEPVSVRNPMRHELRFELARAGSEREPRILFEAWLTSHAPRGVPNDPGRPSTGPDVLAARAYGQHVFTKPAAPPGRHRVSALEDPELPRLPAAQRDFLDPLELTELPEGAEPLEDALSPDAAPVAFGLSHTDGNQHVNFLAYPRLVEDAALRRMSALGLGSRLLARYVEVGYRKPCFAGDRMRILLRAFRHGQDLGALAAFVPDGAPPDTKPHCTLRILLSQ